jgi:hypothetical protein
MLDRMPPDYELRHDVIVRSLLQAIEHGNMPIFLQLLDRGAVEGVDVNTVVIIPEGEGGGDFWRKEYDFFVSDQNGKPLSLVCAAAMEFEMFTHLYEHPDISKPAIHAVLRESRQQPDVRHAACLRSSAHRTNRSALPGWPSSETT